MYLSDTELCSVTLTASCPFTGTEGERATPGVTSACFPLVLAELEHRCSMVTFQGPTKPGLGQLQQLQMVITQNGLS